MRRYSGVITVIAAILAATGCGGAGASTGPGARQMSVSFTTAQSPGTASRQGSGGSIAPQFFTVSAGGDALVVTKAEVVLSKIELAGPNATSCETEQSGHETETECEGLELDPVVIDLPVDASVVTQLHAPIPAGTYTALEAKVRVADGRDAAGAALLAAHPELDGASVRVEGTFNGAPFVYSGSVETGLELRFSPPLVVGTDGANVTVHVDLARWFTTSAGALIDPGTANAGGVNASLVAQNIRASFHAFEDDDLDGSDDH